jgi:hypothetical protein
MGVGMRRRKGPQTRIWDVTFCQEWTGRFQLFGGQTFLSSNIGAVTVVYHWESHGISCSLSFVMYKVEVKIVLLWRTNEIVCINLLTLYLAHNRCSIRGSYYSSCINWTESSREGLCAIDWMFVSPPKSLCWNPNPPTPHCDGVWRWGLWEGFRFQWD